MDNKPFGILACPRCGQGYHYKCCSCGAILPELWDDYDCKVCLDTRIKRNLRALMESGDPYAPLKEDRNDK